MSDTLQFFLGIATVVVAVGVAVMCAKIGESFLVLIRGFVSTQGEDEEDGD